MSYREDLRWRAFDSHGVLTTADAAELGVPAVELRKLAARGALHRTGQGVYRMTEVPPTRLTEYVEAIAVAGPGSVIVDESVLAFHELALVNPRRVKVATGRRVRRRLPATVELQHRAIPADQIVFTEGVPMLAVEAALSACRGRVMPERLVAGGRDALARGLVPAERGPRLLATLALPVRGAPDDDPTTGRRGMTAA